MKRSDKVEQVAQIVFYALALIIFVKMVVTIIKPVSMVVDTEYNKGFYENILSKSTASFEVIGNGYEEDEKSDLFSMVFMYITNIDIGNPRTYIASEIPLLGLFDITNIASNEDGPVVIIPNEEPVPNDNSNIADAGDNNKPKENTEKPNTEKTPTQQTEEKKINPGNITVPDKKKLNPTKPLVLIYHTHISEAYNPNEIENGNHSRDMNIGVAKVGENLKKELESKYGISTMHDTTAFDSPKLEKGYARARPSVQNFVKKYPSLKLIIDLHRDSAGKTNSTTAIINGKRYARIMFVFGAKNKNLAKSKEFTRGLSNYFDKYYPKFSKGFYWQNRWVYNQDITPKLVILEVGSNKNSLGEAINSTEIIAKMIALFLK